MRSGAKTRRGLGLVQKSEKANLPVGAVSHEHSRLVGGGRGVGGTESGKVSFQRHQRGRRPGKSQQMRPR